MSSANGSRKEEFSISPENLTAALLSDPIFCIFMKGRNMNDWTITVKGIEGLIPLVLTERARKNSKVKKGVKFKVYGKST